MLENQGKVLVVSRWALGLLPFVFAVYSFAQDGFVYDAKGRRDPFIPLVTSDGRVLKLETEEGNGKAVLSLEGIIYDKNGLSYAIVNGEVVRIDETIGDYRVLKIEERKVIFIKDGEITEVELKKEEP